MRGICLVASASQAWFIDVRIIVCVEGWRRKSLALLYLRARCPVCREIRKYQKTTELLIRRAPFQRLVREVCHGALRVNK